MKFNLLFCQRMLLGCAVVFVLVRPLGAGWFFAGFLLSQAVIWVSPLLTRGPQTLTGDEVPDPSTMG